MAIAVSGVLLLSAWLCWDREPRYRGIPASSYVLESIGSKSLPTKSPYDGIREMGAELAVPALIRVIEAQDSALGRWYDQLYLKIPAGMRKPFPVPPPRERIVSTAMTALSQFGSDASPSVPMLIRLYRRNPGKVTSTLAAIGPSASNAIPVLIFGLNPTNPSLGPSALCHATAGALWRIDPSGDVTARAFGENPTGSPLQKAVRDFGLQELQAPPRWGEDSSRWATLELLSCIRSEAKQTAPAIARFLRHDNERLRAKAAETLGRLGPVVQEYAGEIRTLLGDDWLMVREAATNALKRIESQRP
jgi:HEAT repeat protein